MSSATCRLPASRWVYAPLVAEQQDKNPNIYRVMKDDTGPTLHRMANQSKITWVKPQKSTSPCIRLCTLDEEDICVGCGRTLDEIREWTSYDPQQQSQVLVRCRERMASRPYPNSRYF